MRKVVHNTVLITLFLTFAINSTATEKKTITLSNGEWAPYLSETLDEYGAGSKIVSISFQAVGIEVEYKFYPWSRSLLYAKQNCVDGTLLWIRTEDRLKDFIFSDPVIIENEHLFFHTSTYIEWKAVEDLRGITIGGTKHTVYPVLDDAERMNIIKIERHGNYDTLFKRLLCKRVDAVPNIDRVGRYYMKTTLKPYERKQILIASQIITKRKYHLILNRKNSENQQRIELFNKGLKALKESGDYDAILNKLDMAL